MSERNINRPIEFSELITKLKKEKDNSYDSAPFDTFAHVIAFAAALGAAENPDEFNSDFKRDDKTSIPFKVFKNQGLETVINALAIKKGADLNVLTGENGGDEKIKIFEGYSYAGLKKLNDIVTQSGLATDNIIRVITKYIDKDKKDKNLKLTDFI
ncbi:MAG: DNA phosphorothioation-associated protein 4 [Halobacteriovoraceae bacterium]|nr:DNA phosphorothioation-associated protein 4 [Halobacteriovoraceae bacterium]